MIRLQVWNYREHDLRLYFNFAFGHSTDKDDGNFSYESQKGRQYDFISESDLTGRIRNSGRQRRTDRRMDILRICMEEANPSVAVKAKGPVPIRFLTVIKPAGVQVETKTELGTVAVKLEDGTELLLEEDKVVVKEGGKRA